ncbi:MAG: nuclear transport factor 2 family protein [Chloroflexota bacterium]|nr:nuclear transport factor 2 family protein [Chloroflexota bacterium]
MEESAEVREIAMHYFDAMCRGDTPYLEQFVSRDDSTLLIGTDPNEWWTGYDRIMGIWKAQLEAMGGSFPITASNLQAYRDGNVGWFAAQPVLRLPDGTDLPFRMTAVVRQEDGDWKIVSSHASFGVPNEEAVGEELPT